MRKRTLFSIAVVICATSHGFAATNAPTPQVIEKVDAYCELYRFSGHFLRASQNLCDHVQATLQEKRLSLLLGELMTDLKPLKTQGGVSAVAPFVKALVAIVDAAPQDKSPSNTLGRWKKEALALLD
ncbi:MAG: hypothetical protein C0514_00070 [Candidatus Puniceispirillum sp.]|nr:hypothetical protein [Candidatus Puniceispirillum sp.]